MKPWTERDRRTSESVIYQSRDALRALIPGLAVAEAAGDESWIEVREG